MMPMMPPETIRSGTDMIPGTLQLNRRDKITPVPPGEQIIDTIAAKCNNKVLLAFSCGKDAIAAWLALKARGVEVVPYYYYLCPDLEFIESSLKYYEEYFETPIMRVPSPSIYRLWRNCVYQPPERLPDLLASRMPKFNDHDLSQAVKRSSKISLDTWTALGVRAADSVNRRTNFVMSGAAPENKKKFYPVWDWLKARLQVELHRAKIKLPIDYWIFGRTFDGIDYRFIGPLKKHLPEDYERLKHYYPFIECEIKRAEMAGKTDHLKD